MADSDFRFDPFTFKYLPKNITGEAKTVEFFPAFRRCGFFLSETPQRLTSAPMRVICGGDTLAEVSRISAPAVNNFRVDYGNVNNFAQTGFVEIHADRIGQVASINYRGLGNNLNASRRADAVPNIQRSIRTPLNATAAGLTMPALEITAGISAKNKRFGGVNAVTAGDLVSLAQFIGLNRRPQPVFLSGSGNYVFPSNVKKVLFVLIGPGGNGHISGGGGGGGAAVYGIADLETIGGDMFAYVVGIVGIATTMFGCVAGAGSSASSVTGAAGGTGSVGVGVVGVGNPGGAGGSSYFLAVANSGTNRAMASVDATSWVGYSVVNTSNWKSVVYGNGVLVAVGDGGTDKSMYSFNGRDWLAGTGCGGVLSVTFGNGVFVAVGNNAIYTSTDGQFWTARTVPQANQWLSVTYGGGLFVAVGDGGTNRVMTSPDGSAWTLRNHAGAALWTAVTYGNGLFVAVGQFNAGAAVMTSSDGITWISRTTPVALGVASDRWYGVAYGNGYYVAVSNYSLGGNYAMNSPDGINWTLQSVPELANEWNDITFGNGLFVAVASSGTNRVMTSADGSAWTARAASAANQWQGVAYIPAGGGGNAAGGLGVKGAAAELSGPPIEKAFFQGQGGIPSQPDGESFGGGGGAGGNGAPGAILLLY